MLETLNRLGHGYVAVPAILAFAQGGMFGQWDRNPILFETDFTHTGRINTGHLRVVLRILESLGVVSRTDSGGYRLRQRASDWEKLPPRILEADRARIEDVLRGGSDPGWLKWANESSRGQWCGLGELACDFLDGVILVPVLLFLWESRTRGDDGERGLAAVHQRAQPLLMEWFGRRGWMSGERLNEVGRFMLARAMNLGTVASYEPMLRSLPELLFGKTESILTRGDHDRERHVDRQLNVVSSGFQHHRYFEDVEELLLTIFDQEPMEMQPRAVADMGCGDGTFLRKIYEIIREKSKRGRCLERYPLRMIGVDFNEDALVETHKTLTNAQVPHLMIRGDIGDPSALIRDLETAGMGGTDEVLHVRSFLDHNRPFLPPKNRGRTVAMELGDLGELVAVDETGSLIPSDVAYRSLVEHLERWRGAVNRHGLVILEVHSLESDEVRQNLDTTESLHFDAYHGFSGQHLVGARLFLMAAAEAGLFARRGFSQRYPRSLAVTRITLSWFEPRPYIVRPAVPDDLEALVAIEGACWPEGMRADRNEIAERLRGPGMHNWVLVLEGKVGGVLYIQRISDEIALSRAGAADLRRLRNAGGPIAQLLGMNVPPELWHLGLGDQLLDFGLQDLSLRSDVEKVMGITRCKEFARRKDKTLEEYAHTLGPDGLPIDPILRFHAHHGARIIRVARGFRPADVDNEGCGVLIEYSLRGMDEEARSSSMDGTDADFRGTGTTLDKVREAIQRVIGEKKMAGYQARLPLMEMGVDSLGLLELRTVLGRMFLRKLAPVFFFQHTTPEAIARFFDADARPFVDAPGANGRTQSGKGIEEIEPGDPVERGVEPIAIIGMACRFPGGVTDAESFWELLKNGRDAIEDIPKNRWDAKSFFSTDRSPGTIACGRGGFVSDVDQFDADFFRISPREAVLMDPQQRLLLQVSWEALENAGLNPQRLAGSETGIYLGIFSHDYEGLQLRTDRLPDLDGYFATGTAASVAAGRLAYFYGFQGPAISVDTACSSSLAGLHLACQSLRARECDLALAAGVNLILTPYLSMAFSRAGMLSPQGKCRTFDASADGYVRSEGCAVLVLKPLAKARQDGDRVLAVVRGSAINQDGASNGLTAPNVAAQEAVLRRALASAGVTPLHVSYVEAHGTGTPLGDPIEFQALSTVYGGDGLARRGLENPLVLGSVKTNIGHTEAVAGLAGVIKVVLALGKRWIPPNLHFEKPNPHLDLGALPAVVPTVGQAWMPPSDGSLLAGVSSFGFSGTNAHALIGETPGGRSQLKSTLAPGVLTLSARTPKALKQLARRYLKHLDGCSNEDLPDLAFTTNVGRAHFEHRAALVATTVEEARRALNGFVLSEKRGAKPDRVTMIFTGQGSQYAGMGQELYATQQVFRQSMEECDALLREHANFGLEEVLYGRGANDGTLEQTARTQPVLFSLEYSLAKQWEAWGIRPSYVLGHSLGEYAAACVAGLWSLEDALRIVSSRARLMQALPAGGAMIAVMASKERVERARAAFSASVSVAAWNGPESAVISGVRADVERVAAKLAVEGVATIQLPVSHAFHSPLMNPMVQEFRGALDGVQWNRPRIPIISNVTGDFAGEEIRTSNYWCRHVLAPVQFQAGIERLSREGAGVFLEIGPKPVLIGMARSFVTEGTCSFLASLTPGEAGLSSVCRALAEFYERGFEIDWEAVHARTGGNRVTLPTYPFETQRYWVVNRDGERSPNAAGSNLDSDARPLLGRRLHSPLRQVQFEQQFGCVELPFFRDHMVRGRILLPFAAVVEMALVAARQLLPGVALTLTDVTMGRAVELRGDDAIKTQFILTPEEGCWRFDLHVAGRVDGEWSKHASGIVATLANGEKSAIDTDLLTGSSRRRISGPDFYGMCSKRGIGYGPSFQILEELSLRNQQAVGWMKRNSPGDVMRAPMTVLDGCLQVGFAALPEQWATRTFIPVKMDRLELLGEISEIQSCVATVRSFDDPRCIIVDYDCLNETGGIIARVRGFQMTSAKTGVGEEDLYSIEWLELRGRGTRDRSPDDQIPAGLFAQPEFDLDCGETGPLERLEAVAAVIARDALLKLGVNCEGDPPLAIREALGRGGWPIQHQRYLSRLIEIALECSDKGVTSRGDSKKKGELWSGKKTFESMERWDTVEEELLAHCGEHLERVLSGRVEAVEVLFSGANGELLRRFYTESRSMLAMNDRLREVVDRFLRQQPEGRRLRVLEIGAGTGATTARLLPLFPPDTTDYVFSDVSAGFFETARRRFSEFPFVRFERLDIEQPPIVNRGLYDLVIAANVMHATRNLQAALEHVRQLMDAGGTLLLLEGIKKRNWVDVIFGMTEGWWRFSGEDGRTMHPLLSAEAWQHLLERTGFESVSAAIPANENEAVFPQAILTGSRRVEAKRWLLAGEEGEFAKALAGALTAGGDQCVVATNGYLTDDRSSWDGVVFLARLEEAKTEAAEVCAESCLAFVQGLLGTQVKLTGPLWIVTRGAAPFHARSDWLGHAPLWGLAKVIELEHPELKSRVVDLDPASDEDTADALAFELRFGDEHERQVVFRDGKRFAPRLRRCEVAIGQNQAWHASSKGILDEMSLEWVGRPQPGPGQIEIEVRASGLNFLDVMEAAKMLPFVRPEGLGMECAGIVRRVGTGVKSAIEGNRVMALAPGALRQYAVVNAHRVATLPDSMSFEEAAALPVNYLTALHALKEIAQVVPGERVLIHAGASGTGLAAVRVARALGAEVFATCSPSKRGTLSEMGVRHIFNSRSTEFSRAILVSTGGEGVDVVLNSLTGEMIPRSLELLREGGRFLELGKTDVWNPERVRSANPRARYFPVDLYRLALDEPKRVAELFRWLLDGIERGELGTPVRRVFAWAEVKEGFRVFQRAAHVGKVVFRHAAPNGEFDGNGAYLITGGLGGLGLELARWMVEKGARTLVLAGRSTPSAEAALRVRELESQGARIWVRSIDVADAADLGNLFEAMRLDLPPLRGVIHAAGVLDDGVLAHQTGERFRRVLRPKVAGGWNLHLLTRGMSLDFFVLFSSTASMLGASGQGNHAAANAFLDSLAVARAADGLVAQSLQWGAWGEIGAALEAKAERNLEQKGIGKIYPSEALELLERSLASGRTQMGIARVDWEAVFRQRDGGRYLERLRPRASVAVVDEEARTVRSLMAGLPGMERREALARHVSEHVSRVLSLRRGIDLDEGFFDLGLDSLTSVELRNRLQSSLECSLPATVVFDYPNVGALAGFLAKELGWEPAGPVEQEPVSTSRESELDKLSDHDLAALLEQQLESLN